MKRVLIITSMFPNRYNPVSGIFVQHQVDELAKRYDVRVIATIFPYPAKIEHAVTPLYKVSYVFFPLFKDLFISSLYYYGRYAIPVIKSAITEWEPDIIHVHDYKHVPELFLLHNCLQKFKIPRYLTVHNIRNHPSMIKSSRVRWFYGLSFTKSYSDWTHIFTVNNRLKDFISKSIKTKGITSIGNAIGPVPQINMEFLEQYKRQLSETEFKILSVGNLIEEKGFDLLINAVSTLVKKNYQIQVFIIGSGPEENKLTELIDKLGLKGSIILTGRIENDIVRNLYPFFDAFVLPSYSETFGVVYIEAMDAGLPVIGVKGQGVDGIVQHGINGLLVNPQDVNDLTEKIEYLLTHKDLARAMAVKGQNLIKSEYQLSQLIDKIATQYEK